MNKIQSKKQVPFIVKLLRFGIKSLHTISPQLSGKWVYHLWFRTHRFPEPKRESQWREKAHQLILDHDDGPLSVYQWGEGPNILLIHGWNGRGTQMGSFAEPLMKAGYRAVAFDAPGHGRTPGKETTIFRIIHALNRVVEKIGPIKGMITHSFGAMVAVRALRSDLMTERVVCISPPSQMKFLVESFCGLLQIPFQTRKIFEQLLEKEFGANIWELISADLNAAGLSIPALIIHDKDDHEVPWQQGNRLANAWPGALFTLTKGLGHRRILFDKETIRTAVDFITDGKT